MVLCSVMAAILQMVYMVQFFQRRISTKTYDISTWGQCVWLRFNCHCPTCKQEHSGQKTMDVADIDINAIIKMAHVTKNGKITSSTL
jgi:hypothetical protein